MVVSELYYRIAVNVNELGIETTDADRKIFIKSVTNGLGGDLEFGKLAFLHKKMN